MKKINSENFFKKSLITSLVVGACFAGAVSAEAEERYIIKFKDNWDGNNTPVSMMSVAEKSQRAQSNIREVSKAGGLVKRTLVNSNAIAAMMTKDEVARLEAKGIVEYVEVDPVRQLITPVNYSVTPQAVTPQAESSPYGIAMVQANLVSDLNTANMKVCITDTGYDGAHEDLRPYTASNIAGNDNDGNGNDTGDWFNDGYGHGTHVAGTIAGIGGNGIGVVGVNPSDLLNLHIVKVFTDAGTWGYGSDMVAAIDQCVAAGSDVVSMSLGGTFSSTTENNAFQNAYDNGVLFIAASGNDGTVSGNDVLSYPASYDSVVSVGALDSSKQIASFSQKNAPVELSAPGVAVLSTLPGNTYASWDGTSMATPHVSGVAALVWSHFPACTNAQIRNALNDSSEDLGSAGRDQSYGYGLVQAKAAYDYLTTFGCAGDTGGGGGGTGELTNGVAETNISGGAGEELHYYIDVPAGATDLSIAMSGGTGDADMYVRFGSAPTTSTYDCRPFNSGNNETCSSATPNEGRYYVMVRGYSAFSGVSLTASYTGGGGGGGTGELTNGVAQNNLSGATGSQTPYYIDVPSGASNLNIAMAGGTGDADLYVRFGSAPTTTTYDCRPYLTGNNETCSFATPNAGRYYIMLDAYSAYSGVSLTASYDEPSAGGSINESNLSAATGSWNYFTITVPAGMSVLDLNISGGTGDADMYVRYGAQPTTTTYDCRPYNVGNTENCNFTNPAAGTWYIGIRAYSSYSGVNLTGDWN